MSNLKNKLPKNPEKEPWEISVSHSNTKDYKKILKGVEKWGKMGHGVMKDFE